MPKANKKNTITASNTLNVNSETVTPVDMSIPFCMDDFPAVPTLQNRLMRISYSLETLTKRKREIEQAIDAAPKNLAVLADEKRITDFISHNALIGVQIDRKSAMTALGITSTSNSATKLETPLRIRSRRVHAESLELALSDEKYLAIYQRCGQLTASELIDKLPSLTDLNLSAHEIERYPNISRNIAHLEGKTKVNGYIDDIDPSLRGLEALQALTLLENAKNKSTISLVKRAVRIHSHLK